jgi:hypothetical protein
MRLNDVEICNVAISLCGSTDFIMALSQDSIAAKRCARLLPMATQTVLRKHDWNCATKITPLARNTAAPAFLYEYAYNLPYDLVRLIDVYGDSDFYNPHNRWKVRGREIHTNLDTVFIEYVSMPEDYRDLDILLSGAIAHELATLLAATMIKDAQMYGVLNNAKQRVYMEAQAIDTLENKYVNTENEPWADARTEWASANTGL